jgi:hypothetical protein
MSQPSFDTSTHRLGCGHARTGSCICAFLSQWDSKPALAGKGTLHIPLANGEFAEFDLNDSPQAALNLKGDPSRPLITSPRGGIRFDTNTFLKNNSPEAIMRVQKATIGTLTRELSSQKRWNLALLVLLAAEGAYIAGMTFGWPW